MPFRFPYILLCVYAIAIALAPDEAHAADWNGATEKHVVYLLLVAAGAVAGIGVYSNRYARATCAKAARAISTILAGKSPDLESIKSKELKLALKEVKERVENNHTEAGDETPDTGAAGHQEECDEIKDTLALLQDDLDRKKVLLNQANSELVSAIQSRADFIERMGREIKVPLNTIIGLADILGRSSSEPLSKKQLEHVGRISERAFDIIGVVNDFTQFSSLDSDIKLNLEEIDLSHLCRRCIESLEPMARSKRVTIVQETPNTVIRADHDRFRFVLHDLIHNAVKFNRDGGTVTVSAVAFEEQREGEPGQPCGSVEIKVRDTGLGISQTDISRLFKPFSQLPDEHGMKPRGSGLSLYLVRKFVEMHGGRITVDSKRGYGSTFTINLPCSVAGLGRKQEPVLRKVLVVEDDPAQMNLVMRCLATEPFELHGAENGIEALKMVLELKPDLILMDVVMPKLDGISVCKTLKQDERYKTIRHVPIVIMTSMDDPRYRIEGAKAGADEFLNKPLDISLMKERLRSLLMGKERFDRMVESYRTKEREASTDSLTGLYNRRSMEMMLPELFMDSTSNDIGLSLLMMDLDLFKTYNDTHGHQAGDELLRKAAAVFKHEVREVDVVARYGGEEFIVILPGTPRDLAMSVAERIRGSVSENTECTLSIGVACFPVDSGTPYGLIECADKALYAAKRAGRNRVFSYSDLD